MDHPLGGPSDLAATGARRDERHPGLQFVLAFWLAMSLGAGLPLAIRAGNPQAAADLGVWLSWAVCVVAALRLAYLALDGSMRVLSLSFWVFVYVWLGAAPLAQFGLGFFPHRGSYTRTEVLTAFAIVGVGLACYEAGKRIPLRAFPATGLVLSAGRRTVVLPRVLAFGVGAIVTTLALVYFSGATGLFFSAQTQVLRMLLGAVGEHTERLHLVSRAIQVPPFLAFYLVVWLLTRHRADLTRPQRYGLVALGAVLLVVNLLVSNPINSSRYWVGNIVLSIGLLALPWSRRRSFLAWAALLTLALLLVFPYADLFRHDVDPGQFEFRGLEPVAAKADYDAFQQLLNAVAFVDENGLRGGRQLAGTLLFWVPRAWWPAKPLASGMLVAEFSSYLYTNLSMPLWAEAYLDGGFLAVALAFLLFGCLSETLEAGYLADGSRSTLFHILLPMLAGFQLFLLRGALMPAVAYLTPLLLGVLLATRRPESAD
jgi:hypothetical protein